MGGFEHAEHNWANDASTCIMLGAAELRHPEPMGKLLGILDATGSLAAQPCLMSALPKQSFFISPSFYYFCLTTTGYHGTPFIDYFFAICNFSLQTTYISFVSSLK